MEVQPNCMNYEQASAPQFNPQFDLSYRKETLTCIIKSNTGEKFFEELAGYPYLWSL